MCATERATPDVIDQIYLRGNDGLVQLANKLQKDERPGVEAGEKDEREGEARPAGYGFGTPALTH